MIALWSNNNAEDKLMHMRNLHVLPVVLPANTIIVSLCYRLYYYKYQLTSRRIAIFMFF